MAAACSGVARTVTFSFLIILCVCTPVRSQKGQPTLRITSPAEGTIVKPGQVLSVIVEASPAGAFQEIIIVGASPIGFSQVTPKPPYRSSILIPPDITPRRYSITADGIIAAGHGVSSEPITIIAERPDTPVSLKAETSALVFDSVGDDSSLAIIGVFQKQERVDLSESSYIKYLSDKPMVASVNSTGIVTATGTGRANITATYRKQSVVVPVTVRPPLTALPEQKALHASETQQFVALVMGPSMPAVAWTSSPAGVGSISPTGLYTAPASIPSLQIVTITATDPANNTQTSSASVTLYPPVSLTMAPNAVTLGPSQTQQFAATIQYAAHAGLIWSGVPAGVGSITETGFYTAPATIATPQKVTITATSVADSTNSASAIVTLNPPMPRLRRRLPPW
jgi:hypothetical protein